MPPARHHSPAAHQQVEAEHDNRSQAEPCSRLEYRRSWIPLPARMQSLVEADACGTDLHAAWRSGAAVPRRRAPPRSTLLPLLRRRAPSS